MMIDGKDLKRRMEESDKDYVMCYHQSIDFAMALEISAEFTPHLTRYYEEGLRKSNLKLNQLLQMKLDDLLEFHGFKDYSGLTLPNNAIKWQNPEAN